MTFQSKNAKVVAAISKLPEESNHSRKGFINIQVSDDNRCLKWCFSKTFKSCKPARIRFFQKTSFHKRKFSCQYYRYSQSLEKNCITINVFDFWIYISKNTFKVHVDLLSTEQKDQCHYVLIKNINIFMGN